MKKLFIASLFILYSIHATAGLGSFLTTWATTTGTITIPVTNTGAAYSYTVTWTNLTNAGVGNGSVSNNVGNYTITGLTNGNLYQLEITGNFPGFYFNNGTERSKIRSIERWGESVWTSMAYSFYGCNLLVSNASDYPDVSQVTNMSYTFRGASLFNADLSGWNTVNVTTMTYMFYTASAFNGNIGTWNVSKVVSMAWMFWGAEAFNQSLNSWDVSKVTTMYYLFNGAELFNGDISNWNVSSVSDMTGMFASATMFNQNVDGWNVSNVIYMNSMFSRASNFNQNLNTWNVSKVLDMSGMFSQARAFNGNISNWDVSKVTNMSSMFTQADAFNRDIGGWDTGNITNMQSMFDRAIVFNQNLNSWNVIKVINLINIFNGASAFNGDVSNWDVSNVIQMAGAFQATPFNGNISNWNVSKVVTMKSMFANATSFAGNLSTWNVANVTDMSAMFSNAKLFNSDISTWNVSKVTNMSYMFSSATVFNQPLNTWNVGNVTTMVEMFYLAKAFNQALSNWNTSKVTDVSRMFYEASTFNQNIGSWDVSKVTTMTGMFSDASAFNQNISGWNVGAVTNMSFMFDNAGAFNGDIGNWNVSKVTDMGSMFQQAVSFNKDLTNWDVSKVTSMQSMFVFASVFNQALNTWNVSNVVNMQNMFNNAIAFNQDLSLWNVGKVTNMDNMFNNATTFNQNLDKWNISNITRMIGMLNGSAISIANYETILQGWATLDAGETKIPTAVTLGAGGLFYTTIGQIPRTSLISLRTWTITGDALVGSLAIPVINSFTPTSGAAGTSVTITGKNFSATPSSNVVFFGATKASVTSATTTQLTVTVPVGATYKPITVLVNGLQAYSSKPFVVIFAGGSTITASSFAPKVDFTTGTSPRSVSIGDLDGDGKADMAIASVFNNAISIYRNTSQTGSITFAAKVDFTTGASSNPYCVAMGDLDGDGKQDMAVVNYNTNTLSVLRNTSSGPGTISFATKVDFATGAFPRYVSIGDLDADGKPDLVVSNAGSNTISIFRNTSISAGTISYAAKTDLTGTTGGMAVLINDLDDDGRRDLAVANWSNPGALTTYQNMTTVPGSIIFAAKVDFLTGHNFLWSVAAGDLDNDGRSDLASPISSVAAVMRNNSTSGSISFDPVLDLAATAYASFISIDDLNGDGKVDLAVSNDSNGSISAFENTNTGVGVVSFGSKVDFMTGALPVSNAIADIDGDGRADLIVPNHDANIVSVLRNTMGTSSSPPTITSFTPASGPVGTSVIITGTNFSTTTTSNEVKLNGTTVIVSTSTTTSVTVTVPANATTGKITVTVAGNTATSATNFTVTTMTSGNQPPDIKSTTIEAPVNGTVNLDLAALLSDPDDNLDLSTLKIIVPPLSGAIATIDGQSNLILDYSGISFSGTEKLTIEVCDLSGSCAQKELDIEVDGDIVVYNAVSPNGDGKNDFLFLQHLNLMEQTKENHVTILNRWGSVVWEGTNYDNVSIVFSGQNKNGNDLPSGNYFYKVKFSGNYKSLSGYLTLKR